MTPFVEEFMIHNDFENPTAQALRLVSEAKKTKSFMFTNIKDIDGPPMPEKMKTALKLINPFKKAACLTEKDWI